MKKSLLRGACNKRRREKRQVTTQSNTDFKHSEETTWLSTVQKENTARWFSQFHSKTHQQNSSPVSYCLSIPRSGAECAKARPAWNNSPVLHGAELPSPSPTRRRAAGAGTAMRRRALKSSTSSFPYPQPKTSTKSWADPSQNPRIACFLLENPILLHASFGTLSLLPSKPSRRAFPLHFSIHSLSALQTLAEELHRNQLSGCGILSAEEYVTLPHPCKVDLLSPECTVTTRLQHLALRCALSSAFHAPWVESMWRVDLFPKGEGSWKEAWRREGWEGTYMLV